MTTPMIVPNQFALALVAESPRGDRLVGFVSPPQSRFDAVSLSPETAGKWATIGELVSWVEAHAPTLPGLGPGCRFEPIGLLVPGPGAGR